MKKLTVGLAVAVPLLAAAAIPAAATTLEIGPLAIEGQKVELPVGGEKPDGREPGARAVEDVAGAAPGGRELRRYIVSLREGADPLGVTDLLGVTAPHVYRHTLPGFAAALTPNQVDLLRGLPAVLAVEPDRPVGTAEVGWGLDRLDERLLPLDGRYGSRAQGVGVTAYLIDSGIDTSVADFQGRARNVFDALGGDGQDCNGHGTHVAGIVGGAEYGVAKKVQLRGLRVLDCDGAGWTSDVIAALDWVAGNAKRPAVANLSLTGPYSKALNEAARQVVDSGIFLAVAAGNNGKDACQASPASAPGVLTVGATDRYDRAADFSNYGRCVEVYAPGVGITSDWAGGGTETMNGTSMAAPYAVGVGALYLSTRGPASPQEMRTWIVRAATDHIVAGNPDGTTDRLLHLGGL